MLMIQPCFTEIQLIHNFIFKLGVAKNFAVSAKILSSEIILMDLIHGDFAVSLRLIQIQRIIKIQISSQVLKDSLWFDCKRCFHKKLGNVFSFNNLKEIDMLERVFNQRIFKYLYKVESKHIEIVLGVPLIVATLLKYVSFRTGEEVMLLNKDINKNLRGNNFYKGIYQARFGKTGFGLNLNWRKNYVKKIKEKESIY